MFKETMAPGERRTNPVKWLSSILQKKSAEAGDQTNNPVLMSFTQGTELIGRDRQLNFEIEINAIQQANNQDVFVKL